MAPPKLQPGERSEHLLVVEDHHATRVLLGECLADLGWQPHLAASPKEARELSASYPVELVIMDVCLPAPSDGEELARDLRSIRQEIPILAVSASPEERTAERIGAYAFLPKPFELQDLLNAVQRGLHRT